MSRAVVGMLAGMALGFAGYFGGFGAFVLVAALGAGGFVAGRFPHGHPGTGGFLPSAGRAAGEGGETRLADGVVAKIAAQAAKEAVDTTPKEAASPRATVTVHRD